MGTKKDELTAPVTEPEQPIWETFGVSKDNWDAMEIPDFLRCEKAPCTPQLITPVSTPFPVSHHRVPVSIAGQKTGNESGQKALLKGDEFEKPKVNGLEVLLKDNEFEKFRVNPDEIEQQIRIEADRRWREWLPTKTSRRRPRKSWYEKKVRKEFYK